MPGPNISAFSMGVLRADSTRMWYKSPQDAEVLLSLVMTLWGQLGWTPMGGLTTAEPPKELAALQVRMEGKE